MIASGTRWRVLVALALVTALGCWLQAGFDARRSGFNNGETAVTPADVDDLDPAWSAPVGGTPGEPLVYGGAVYLRTPGSVRAFDTSSGATRWTATCTPTWTAELPAAAAGRPAVGAGVVYVGGEDGTVTALDGAGCGAATCDPLWSATVPGAVTGTVIDGGVLYVASASGGAGTLSTFRLPA